jgi:hypothetical protein
MGHVFAGHERTRRDRSEPDRMPHATRRCNGALELLQTDNEPPKRAKRFASGRHAGRRPEPDHGWWRRKGRGDKRWIIGDVDIRATDVVFADRASQDFRYDPRAVEIGAQLERDLALHRPFVDALADDKFATVAHHMLAHLEWMRIGAREIGLFEGLHHMFACLRNKGEDYLDFKFGDYPGSAPSKAEAAEHALRMKEIMRSLGWRTYTADELQARVREDFRARLERRLEAWRQLDAYEARPAGSYDVLAKTPLSDMLLYEGDDPEWLAELRGEERLAASAQLVQRLKDLANSGRLTAGEFEDLFQALL